MSKPIIALRLILMTQAVFGLNSNCAHGSSKDKRMFIVHHKTGTVMARAATNNINNALPANANPLCVEDTVRHVSRLGDFFNISGSIPWQSGQEPWSDPSSRFIHFERDAFEWLVSNYLYDIRGGDEPWQTVPMNINNNKILHDMHQVSWQAKPRGSSYVSGGSGRSPVELKVFPLHAHRSLYPLCLHLPIYSCLGKICCAFVIQGCSGATRYQER
jgi:hypothetical protein